MSEDHLIGWLCMWRLQHGSANDGRIDMPGAVTDALVARGWVAMGGDPEWDGQPCSITEAGITITELHGPEWGINTIPAEAT